MGAARTYRRICPSLCGMIAEVEGNEIVSLRGDEAHPLTKGYFCVKGLAGQDEHVGEDRLRAARKRVRNGTVEIAIEQALDEIHHRLAAILERHGPRAVALYYGTGANTNSVCHSAMKGWAARLVGTPHVFSSMTVDQSAKWVTAGRMGMFATGQHPLFDADVGLMIGLNPVISHAGVPLLPFRDAAARIREAKHRGAKLIVVDPLRTETARLADLHLQSKPGEDAALVAGMIHVILAEGLHDRAFCERFVTSLGSVARLGRARWGQRSRRLERGVHGSTDLAPRPP